MKRYKMLFRGHRRVSIYKRSYGDTPIDNHTKIMSSKRCGCVCCNKIFRPTQIKMWTDEGKTPICPYCGVDTVSGYTHGRLSFTLLQHISRGKFGGKYYDWEGKKL
jgi:hypothetical protein